MAVNEKEKQQSLPPTLPEKKIEGVVDSQFDPSKIDPRATIKQGVVVAVSTVNTVLADLERMNYSANSNVMSIIRPLGARVRDGLKKGVTVYEQRQRYGLPIVVGSASAVAIIVGARRGKVPAVVTGALAGSGSYFGVYGVPK